MKRVYFGHRIRGNGSPATIHAARSERTLCSMPLRGATKVADSTPVTCKSCLRAMGSPLHARDPGSKREWYIETFMRGSGGEWYVQSHLTYPTEAAAKKAMRTREKEHRGSLIEPIYRVTNRPKRMTTTWGP